MMIFNTANGPVLHAPAKDNNSPRLSFTTVTPTNATATHNHPLQDKPPSTATSTGTSATNHHTVTEAEQGAFYLLPLKLRDRPNNTPTISQGPAILKLLERTGMTDCSPDHTLMAADLHLSKKNLLTVTEAFTLQESQRYYRSCSSISHSIS
jgi:hypothetical protein